MGFDHSFPVQRAASEFVAERKTPLLAWERPDQSVEEEISI
jgi:hypothetical protein